MKNGINLFKDWLRQILTHLIAGVGSFLLVLLLFSQEWIVFKITAIAIIYFWLIFIFLVGFWRLRNVLEEKIKNNQLMKDLTISARVGPMQKPKALFFVLISVICFVSLTAYFIKLTTL